MEEITAEPERAAPEQFARITRPGVLASLEPQQTAQEKHGAGYVRVNLKEELVNSGHGTSSSRRIVSALALSFSADRFFLQRSRRSDWDSGPFAPEQPLHGAKGGRCNGRRCAVTQPREGVERAGVGRAGICKPATQDLHDIADTGQPPLRLFRRNQGQEFEKHRKNIRQLVTRHFPSGPTVFLNQANHRLTSLSGFSHPVFEDRQRMGRISIEGLDIGLL
jgi:hypothetical protein